MISQNVSHDRNEAQQKDAKLGKAASERRGEERKQKVKTREHFENFVICACSNFGSWYYFIYETDLAAVLDLEKYSVGSLKKLYRSEG